MLWFTANDQLRHVTAVKLLNSWLSATEPFKTADCQLWEPADRRSGTAGTAPADRALATVVVLERLSDWTAFCATAGFSADSLMLFPAARGAAAASVLAAVTGACALGLNWKAAGSAKLLSPAFSAALGFLLLRKAAAGFMKLIGGWLFVIPSSRWTYSLTRRNTSWGFLEEHHWSKTDKFKALKGLDHEIELKFLDKMDIFRSNRWWATRLVLAGLTGLGHEIEFKH